MEEELNLELDELDEFDAKPAMYQVWILGYDENEAITDFEVLVNESRDPERTVEYAKTYISEKRYETLAIPENVEYIEVLVETVVDVEDYESNEGTLFSDTIKLK